MARLKHQGDKRPLLVGRGCLTRCVFRPIKDAAMAANHGRLGAATGPETVNHVTTGHVTVFMADCLTVCNVPLALCFRRLSSSPTARTKS